jgi:hypothetical protein
MAYEKQMKKNKNPYGYDDTGSVRSDAAGLAGYTSATLIGWGAA